MLLSITSDDVPRQGERPSDTVGGYARRCITGARSQKLSTMQARSHEGGKLLRGGAETAAEGPQKTGFGDTLCKMSCTVEVSITSLLFKKKNSAFSVPLSI